jgi:hypothetical protein
MKERCSCSTAYFVAKLSAEGPSANSFEAVLRNIGLFIKRDAFYIFPNKLQNPL